MWLIFAVYGERALGFTGGGGGGTPRPAAPAAAASAAAASPPPAAPRPAPAAPAPPRPPPLEELREAGNAAMRRGDAASAAKLYSRMLLLAPDSVVALANRAQAHLALREPRLAALDATDALRRDPYHVKCWVRRAAARTALGMHAAAVSDLRAAAALDPGNKAVAAELRKAEESRRASGRRLPDVDVPVRAVM